MSGTLTIRYSGGNRTVRVISKDYNSVETFIIPINNNYQLILNEDCKIQISNSEVGSSSFNLMTDYNSNITMKVLKMSNSETSVGGRFNSNSWLKEFNHNVRDNWNNVVDMGSMFYSCSNLTSITLPNELPNVTNMYQMFGWCNNLTNVTLPSELPNITNMRSMFRDCASFNGNLSNTKFKSDVNKGTGVSAYDYNTPLWLAVNKPQFVL